MMFTRGAKQSIEIIGRRISTPIHSRYLYSTKSYRENIFEPKINVTNCTILRKYSTEVSPSDHMTLIKKLRERTSAPIKEVKSALIDCNWDLEAAQKELRKRGIVLASKKSGRTAAEGLLALAQNDKKAAVIELNCETDFVARNEIFQHLALSLAKLALSAENSEHVSGAFPVGLQSFEDLKINFEHPKLSGETTVQNAITEVAAMMGENVKLRRGFAMSTSKHGVMSTYLHTSPQPGLGRIAGILSLEVDDENASLDAVQRVGAELAMHVVAAKPLVLTKELVSSDAVQNEREILKSQFLDVGPEERSGAITLDYSDIWLEHLNEFQIDYGYFKKNNFEFVKLILTKSHVLKKLKIYFDIEGDITEDDAREISVILLISPHASPAVEIIVEVVDNFDPSFSENLIQ